jgi:hypothetical protein
MRARRPAAERFWEKVDTSGDCWLWTAGVGKNGYGLFKPSDADGTTTVHRYALSLAGRDIPEGMHVDHLCRNRLCVNPAHLDVVTQAENNRRAMAARPTPTACKYGHALTSDNLKPRENGRTRCAECQRRAAREYARRVRATT